MAGQLRPHGCRRQRSFQIWSSMTWSWNITTSKKEEGIKLTRNYSSQPKRQLFDFIFASFMVSSTTVLPCRSMVWSSFSFSLGRQNPSLDMERWRLDLHFSWGLEIVGLWFNSKKYWLVQDQDELTQENRTMTATVDVRSFFAKVKYVVACTHKHHIDDEH